MTTDFIVLRRNCFHLAGSASQGQFAYCYVNCYHAVTILLEKWYFGSVYVPHHHIVYAEDQSIDSKGNEYVQVHGIVVQSIK